MIVPSFHWSGSLPSVHDLLISVRSCDLPVSVRFFNMS